MKRFFYPILMLVFLVGSVTGCNNGDTSTVEQNTTMTITDSLGRTVEVPADASKFVAIGPGCLRLYCYVGDVSKIVGVEQTEITNGAEGRPYAKANPELLSLPVIGAVPVMHQMRRKFSK